MKIPEFTAEASLYKTRNRRRSVAFDHGSSKKTIVLPQIGNRNFKGLWGCEMDCMDQHPNWTHEQCRRSCTDPFGGSDLGTSRSFWDGFLSDAGIDFWEAGCTGITGASGPCGWLADFMRRQS
jgi:hypothetical protein